MKINRFSVALLSTESMAIGKDFTPHISGNPDKFKQGRLLLAFLTVFYFS